MKRLPTQFDQHRLATTVATPTCSSCCCCCCCLATSISSSTLLAQRVNNEAKAHGTKDRFGLVLLASLYLPVIAAITYFAYWLLDGVVRTCTQQTDSYGSYQICTGAPFFAVPIFAFSAAVLVLWYLYTRVQVGNPLRRAFLITILVAIALTIEAFAIGALILMTMGVGLIAYLCVIPFIIGGLAVWYRKHLLKGVTPITTTPPDAGQSPSSQSPLTPPSNQ